MNRYKKCRHGVMIFPANDRFLGRSLDYYGEFSEGEVSLLRRLVPRDGFVVDAGANIGALTVPLALAVPDGHVYSYEPQRTLYMTLCGNVALSGLANATCVNAALGRAPGVVRVPELDQSVGQNFGGLDIRRQYEGVHHEVPVVSLDAIGLTRCDLIKIDVEGMELDVIDGGRRLIAAARPYLYIEDDSDEVRDSLRGLVRALGYRIYDHWPILYSPDNYFLNPTDVFAQAFGGRLVISRNILCVPPTRPLPFDPQGEFGLREAK